MVKRKRPRKAKDLQTPPQDGYHVGMLFDIYDTHPKASKDKAGWWGHGTVNSIGPWRFTLKTDMGTYIRFDRTTLKAVDYSWPAFAYVAKPTRVLEKPTAKFVFEKREYTVTMQNGLVVYKETAHLGGPWSTATSTIANKSIKLKFRKLLNEALGKVSRLNE